MYKKKFLNCAFYGLDTESEHGKIWNRNHNFSKVGTGTVKNSYGSTTHCIPGRHLPPPRPKLQQDVRHHLREPGDRGEAARVPEQLGPHHPHHRCPRHGARRQQWSGPSSPRGLPAGQLPSCRSVNISEDLFYVPYRRRILCTVLYMTLLISNDKLLEVLMYLCDVLFVNVSRLSVSQDGIKTSGQDRIKASGLGVSQYTGCERY